MSKAHNDEPVYTRGRYRLEWDRRSDGSLRTPYLQIVWYDDAAGRNRSKSTGRASVREAEDELDKFFLLRERGEALCPTCGKPRDDAKEHLLRDAMANYKLSREGRVSYKSIVSRLALVNGYLEASRQGGVKCEDVDAEWIDGFREWAIEVPVKSTKGNVLRDRTPGTVEASVRQLAAVINFAHGRKDTLFPASFSAKPPSEVSRTPVYRADIKKLAAMFDYCIRPVSPDGKEMTDKERDRRVGERLPLLRFLQISVATWCRPDAAHDVSTSPEKGQWHSEMRVLDLNFKGRVQTKKYRPVVPVARPVALILDEIDGFVVGVDSVRKAFEGMARHLKLPGDGEAGMKLIRRSMAHLGRQRLGERDWVEGQMMLGHCKATTSDVYAPFVTGYLGRALEVTEAIISEISQACPGAFRRSHTGLRLVQGAASA